MPLVEATLAQAMMKSYDDFKKGKLNSGGNNGSSNGSNNGSSGNSSNQSGNGGNNSNSTGSGSQGADQQAGTGEQGNTGGDGSTPGRYPGTSNVSNKKPKPYVNPNCPVHGQQKPKSCPVCGHSDCGCDFHNPPKEPDTEEPPFGFNGDEINPNNIEDLKKQCEAEDKAYDDMMNGNGGGDNNNNGGMDAGMAMSGEFLQSLSKAIDDELQKATPTMMNVSILIAKGTLFIKPKSNFILYAVEISTKVMLYWSICILPIGIPQAGVITTIVPSNIPALIAPMAQEILMSALSAGPGGNYQKLAEIICKYSRQVIYMVTEITPAGAPVVFPVQLQ